MNLVLCGILAPPCARIPDKTGMFSLMRSGCASEADPINRDYFIGSSLTGHRIVDNIDPRHKAMNNRPQNGLVNAPGNRDRQCASKTDADLGGV